MYAYPFMQNTEDTIAKYAVDANLFQLGPTNPKKNIQSLEVFWCPYGNLSHGKLSLRQNIPR